MKLSKTMKKFVAVISAIAMVIAGITYTPQAVRADIDYASLTYTQATPQGEAPDLYYSIVENTIGGWANPWYGDTGNTFQIVFSADNKTEDTVIKVNDVETTSGVVTLVGLGLIKLNPTQMADNAYTKVEVTATTGTATIVFRKGTPGTGSDITPTETDSVSSTLQWTELHSGISGTLTNTSTETSYGFSTTDFTTDYSWQGDSKWQGQAKIANYAVKKDQAYKISFDVVCTPAKQIFVQELSNGVYDEETFSTADGHIEKTFVAKATTCQIVVAFGAVSEAEVGTYAIEVSNLKIEETEKSDEQNKEEEIKTKVVTDENIAKGKAAFCSSSVYPAQEAFDGNLGSRWAASSIDDNEYVGVNLGALYAIDSVSLIWEGAYASEYEVQVSTDGENYTTVASKTGVTKAEVLEFTFDEPVDAQFVKILCVKAGTQWNTSIWECGVYGTQKGEGITTVEPTTKEQVDYSPIIAGERNIAKGKAVVASSTDPTENGGNVLASNLTDGQVGTYWASYFTTHENCPTEYTDNDNLVIDLGAPIDASKLDKLMILWRTEVTLPTTFSVEVSEDGITYTEAIASTSLDWSNLQKEADVNGIVTYDISELTGNVQYVKINLTGAKPYGYQISEIAVVAKEGTVETTTVAPSESDTSEVAPSESDTSADVPAESDTPTDTPAADPIEVIGQSILEQNGAKVTFTWGQNDEQIALGQFYNVYIDGEPYMTGVAPQAVTYDFTTPGAHVIKITAVLGNKETTGVTLDVTVEGTTPSETDTSADAPSETATSAEPEMVFEQIVGTGEDITKGNIGIWINTTNVMEIAVDPTDANHIQGKIVSNNNNWEQWGAVQYKFKKAGLTPGEEYSISVDLKASANDGVIVTNGDVASVDLSSTLEATLTRTVAADENGNIELAIGAGQVGIGVILDFSNVVIKDAQGNIVTDKPVETPTETPSDTPSETESETPTEAPTETPTEASTVAPTEASTVAPTEAPKTTVAPKKVKAPTRSKISKVNAKKKSSKKVSLKLKRVKRAKGYQVYILKTKKAKKPLAKKITTKLKVTVTSKKLKNKKKLYIKARAYVLDAKGKKVYGKWSTVKRIRIKK